MNTFKHLNAAFLGTAAAIAFVSAAAAGNFNIPGGDLASALNAYTEQSGVALIVSGEAVRGVRTKGVNGALNSDEALSRLLDGTGFVMQHRASGAVTVTRDQRSEISDFQIAQAAPARAAVETVTVTSSKLGGADVQSIPISITALSQEQLTASQTNGGPDLIKQVPNMTFTKTNFSGYSIQLRGIGTQAISVTTDPAVAVTPDVIAASRLLVVEPRSATAGARFVCARGSGRSHRRQASPPASAGRRAPARTPAPSR